MTKKDYIAIAEALANARAATGDDKHSALTYAANQLAAVLARDNPRFDRERFLTACGVK